MNNFNLQNGWYRVTLINNKPAKDEVLHFDDWMEYDNGWIMEDYPNHAVVRVIKPEMEIIMGEYTANNSTVNDDTHDMVCSITGDSIMSPKELVLLVVFVILGITATATVTIALNKHASMMAK